MPNRKLADAWLFWGIPERCERTAKSLHAHSLQAAAKRPGGPAAAAAAAPDPVDQAAAAALQPEAGPAPADTPRARQFVPARRGAGDPDPS